MGHAMRSLFTCLSVLCLWLEALDVCHGEETAASRIRQARALLSEKPKEALAILATCMKDVDDGPTSVEAAEVAATILKALNKNDEAIRWCEWGLQKAKYFSLDDKQTASLVQLQKTLFSLQAADWRRKEIDVLGEDAVLFQEAARLEHNGDYKQALVKYDDLSLRFPVSSYVAPSVVGSGRCLLWLWKVQECQARLKKFVQDAPSGPYREHALLVLGDVALMYYCLGTEAKDSYEKAKKLSGDGRATGKDVAWQAEQRLGITSFAMGDRKSALEYLQKSRALMSHLDASRLDREILGMDVL